MKKFFTEEDLGVSAKINAITESLAGRDHSLLVTRSVSLQSRIELRAERIAFLSERLESERERLLKQFFNMEIAIGKLQSNLAAIASLAPLPLISFGPG
ncbi:MAG: hypothetical protein IH846_14890 [Acidobacteria bacterium]|nr:hypothetical protein [Acidobacteriota bacterium]